MRLAAVAAVVLVAACDNARPTAASDTVVVEVKAPLHARIMEREHEAPVDCSTTSGLIARLSCIFSHSSQHCFWLEIDSPELAAHPFGKDLADCQRLTQLGPRVSLSSLPLSPPPKLEADASGKRLAVIGGSFPLVLWVLDGSVVGAAMPSPPLDWATVGELEERLGSFFSTADEPTRARLLAYAEKNGGEETIERIMGPLAKQSVDRWSDLYDRLETPATRARALKALHEAVADNPPVELVTGLIEYPDLQPPGFQKVMRELTTELLREFVDWGTISPMMEELERRNDPAVPDLACRRYGAHVLGSFTSRPYEVDEASDPVAEAELLDIIARHEAACPWVRIALNYDPCSTQLRCQRDGGAPDQDEAPIYDAETGEELDVEQPLCSPEVAKRLVSPPPGVEVEAEVEDYDDIVGRSGAVLLAAGYRQNAVSKELLARNARRMYRYVLPEAPAPENEGEEYSVESPCWRPRSLPDSVCELPLDVTDVTYNSCRIRIDDKAKVVRVEELKPK